jgi:P pilus assembly chaperone PapD
LIRYKQNLIRHTKHFCVLVILVIANFGTSAQSVRIQPTVYDLHLSANESLTQSLTISNTSNKPVAFQIYLGDWLRDTTGGHQYFKPDTLSRSCASWITLSKNYVVVEPSKTEEITIKFKAPEDLEKMKQMKWAMLFLESAPATDEEVKQSKQLQTSVKQILRVGIHVYQTPPTITKKGLKVLDLVSTNDNNTSFDFSLLNTGDVMLQCKADMELTNVSDGKTYKLDKVEFPVFPDGKRKVHFNLPADLPKGTYSILAKVDIGEDDDLEAIEKTITVK